MSFVFRSVVVKKEADEIVSCCFFSPSHYFSLALALFPKHLDIKQNSVRLRGRAASSSHPRISKSGAPSAMRAVAVNSSLWPSAASTTSSRCRISPLPSSCCSSPLLSLEARHSRSGACTSLSGTSNRSRIGAVCSPEAEAVDDRSSLVAAAAAVWSLSSSTSSSSSSSSSSFAPAATALFSLLLPLLIAAVASPEASAAAAAASTTAAAAAATTATTLSSPQVVSTLADLDPSTAASLASVLRPLFAIAELLFIVRIVLTWYPAVDGDKLPWAVVIKPTEPFLVGTRKVVPPLAGVDVSPVVWVALLSFFSEILVGPQGILVLLSRKVGA